MSADCGTNTETLMPASFEANAAALFGALDTCGLAALHPIEREICAALRARPYRSWCFVQFRMLEMLHAKAHGLPWTVQALHGKPGT
mgnify:CR=1 FL=1